MTSRPRAAVEQPKHEDRSPVSDMILAWYDRHRRDLPWRAKAGTNGDPYAVWLSEIMLQQTTVAAVKPYFAAFLSAWPTVADLAAAALDDILRAWAGLGYYSRARNLHACARIVRDHHDGRFPASEAALLRLPGIGSYTAAAIAAIAFQQRAVVVDGNVERVMSRLFGIETPVAQAKPLIRSAMDRVTPELRCGDFAQAIMDIGATICTPKSPACTICPLLHPCVARQQGRQTELPKKAKKMPVPRRCGAVFFVSRADGCVLVQRRPETGLFGGMTEFPSTPWIEDYDRSAQPALPKGLTGPVTSLGSIEHGLTHFQLTLDIYSACADESLTDTGLWIDADALSSQALPTLMRKVLAKARAEFPTSVDGLVRR